MTFLFTVLAPPSVTSSKYNVPGSSGFLWNFEVESKVECPFSNQEIVSYRTVSITDNIINYDIQIFRC